MFLYVLVVSVSNLFPLKSSAGNMDWSTYCLENIYYCSMQSYWWSIKNNLISVCETIIYSHTRQPLHIMNNEFCHLILMEWHQWVMLGSKSCFIRQTFNPRHLMAGCRNIFLFAGEVEKTACPLTIGADPLEKESRYIGYLDNVSAACWPFIV